VIFDVLTPSQRIRVWKKGVTIAVERIAVYPIVGRNPP
jgi:hypothetical protein